MTAQMVHFEEMELKRLLAELKEGSDEAAWQIVARYSPSIARVVRRQLPAAIQSKVDTADLVNSVWASLLLSTHRLNQLESPAKFVAYLTRTAQIKVFEIYRHYTVVESRDVSREHGISDLVVREGRRPHHFASAKETLTGKDPTASQVARARELWSHLLRDGSDRDRQVVELRLKGLTYEEVGQELGISRRTVRRTLQRLLSGLTG